MYPDLHHPQNHDDDYDSVLLADHDGVVLSYLLNSQQHFSTLDTTSSSLSAETSNVDQASNSNKEEMKKEKKKKKKIEASAQPRKRKMHRHSKICTAQGTRDRRMRLSVPIARKFFDLQDMLGFDKASKTIDWLFTKSKSAIVELKQHYLLASLPPCSSLDSISTSVESNNKVAGKNNKRKKMSGSRSRVGKRSRDEARARARARTEEKMRMRSSRGQGDDQDEGNPRDLGFSCFGEIVEGQMRSNESDYGDESFMGIRSIEDRSSSWPSFQDEGCEFPRFYLEFDTKI